MFNCGKCNCWKFKGESLMIGKLMKINHRFNLLTLFVSFMFTANYAWANGDDIVKRFEQKLSEHKGQVVYIDFWASWCKPCRQSFPWMNAIQKKYKAQGLKVITINIDSDKSNADDFLKEYPAEFEVVYDPKGKLARKFKLKGMPNSFIVDRKGKLVSTHVGFNDKKQQSFENEILALLAEHSK